MQKLDLPDVLRDLKAKISLIEERLNVVDEGIELYKALYQEEEDPLQQFLYKEQWVKRREERIVYYEQLRSQQVYLEEFENDLKKQQAMREHQLKQLKEHLQPMLDAAKIQLKKNSRLSAQDRTLLKTLREQFIKKQFSNDDERISRFKELVNTLQRVNGVRK